MSKNARKVVINGTTVCTFSEHVPSDILPRLTKTLRRQLKDLPQFQVEINKDELVEILSEQVNAAVDEACSLTSEMFEEAAEFLGVDVNDVKDAYNEDEEDIKRELLAGAASYLSDTYY